MFNTDVPEAVDAARCLNDLRGDRNRADYRLKMKGFDSMANAKEKVEIGYATKALVTKCRTDDKIRELVDAILLRHREWLLPFLLTYPHRANRQMCAVVEAIYAGRANVTGV